MQYEREKKKKTNALGINQHVKEDGDQNDHQPKTANILAEKYNVSEPTIKRAIKSNELKAFKVGRDLKSKRQFSDWINGRIEDCGAVEKEDFQTFSQKSEKGRPTIEYIIKLDTAKEMAMLERNEIGKQVRRYFIRIEKKYKENKNSFLLIPFTEIVQSIDIVANSLKVNDASKILMYDKLYNSYGVSTEFLPKYENNGSREIRPATELLDCKKAVFFITKNNFRNYFKKVLTFGHQ